MSKLTSLLVAASGTATVSVGGFYLVKGVGGSTGEGVDVENPVSADLSSFISLDKFKENNGGDCGKYFDQLNLSNGGGTEIDSGSNKIESNYFSGNEDAKSCLVVNWERTDSTSKKWKGYFRWVWSFVQGDKGFIMFTTTKLSNTDKQLDLEGGIYYFLGKSSGSWSIDKHKTLNDKKITSDQFDNEFSKPGESLVGLTNTNSWGFMSSKTDLDSVCKKDEESNCVGDGGTTKTFKGSWTWSKSNNNPSSGTLIKWCKDFENYFKGMYDTNEIALKGNLETLSGAWKKEILEEPSQS